MGNRERDRILLARINEAILRIESYITNENEDSFHDNNILRDACLLQTIVIGEFVSKLSTEVREQYLKVDWQKIKATRNYYVHTYDLVDWAMVWEAMERDLPVLKADISEIIKDIDDAETN